MSRKNIPDGLVLYAMVQAKSASGPLPSPPGVKIVELGARPRSDDGLWPYELLARWTGEPEKVCYAAMERADKHGLIEYGVSLRTGWLTPKGEEVLKAWEQEQSGKLPG